MCRLFVLLFFSIFISCQISPDAATLDKNTISFENDTEGSSKLSGMAIFKKHCVICHGADGKLGLNGAKDLSASKRPLTERVELIHQGKNLMPSFEKTLTSEEIEAVARYTLELSPNSDL